MSTPEHMRQPGVEMFGQYFGDEREIYLSYDQLITARAIGIGSIGLGMYTDALNIIRDKLNYQYPAEQVDLFDIAETVMATDGPVFEVGGPTEDYTPFAQPAVFGETFGRPVYTSNLISYGGINLRADGSSLPLKNKSLGLVSASCLPHDIRNNFYSEAHRTLSDKGVLMYKNGNDLDVVHALSLGFDMVAYRRSINTYVGDRTIKNRTWSFIMRKTTLHQLD